AQALGLLRELAARSAFRPADADPTVTLSSALADPVVEYDGIWVAGLHAEVFPQPVQPDPFLPLPAQVAAGIPAASAAGRLAQARALHAALQRLWERLRDSRSLGALSAAALEALIAASVERAAQASVAAPAGRRHRQRALAQAQLDLFVEMPPALARECRRAARLILR